MKQQQWLLIGGAAFIAAIFSFVISGMLFGNPQKNLIKVPVVTPISSSFPSVSTDDNYKPFLNDNALNPTQLIQIGGSSNTTPFNDSNQQ